jgi:hypothetical protein
MLRLLIDENIDHRILRGLKLRLPQIDYLLVKQIGMAGFSDLELLRWAAREGREKFRPQKKAQMINPET